MTTFNTSTAEGRKALRLRDVKSSRLADALGLGPVEDRGKLSKAALCHMAVAAGLTLRNFH